MVKNLGAAMKKVLLPCVLISGLILGGAALMPQPPASAVLHAQVPSAPSPSAADPVPSPNPTPSPAPSPVPKLTIPDTIKPVGDYAIWVPDDKTNVRAITYVPLSGVDPFPAALLADKRAFVLPVRGLPAGQYKFRAVGSLNDVHVQAEFAVAIGEAIPSPKPPKPEPPKPDPPKDPAPPATGFYFLIVRPDGPAAPAFAKLMQDVAWQQLARAGHRFKDKTLTEARAMGLTVPAGTSLPCVFTLREAADKSESTILKRNGQEAIPLPTNSSDILKLTEGAQ